MTNHLRVTIGFERFASSPIECSFTPGLHIIYGESGAGKSSFARQLGGIKPQTPINFSINIEERPDTVQIILQNPDQQIINPTIIDELAFNYECHGLPPHIIKSYINEIKTHWEFLIDDNRHPVTLSGGEKEILNIETSLSNNPDYLIMDDCLSFLNDDAKKKLVKRFEKHIHDKQSIILWCTSDKKDLFYSDNRYELTLSSFDKINNFQTAAYELKKKFSGKLSIIAKGLTLKAGKKILLEDFSCKSEGIRCLGIAGKNGCGKSTLARVLNGLFQPDSGEIHLALRHKENLQIGFLDQFPERLLASGCLHDLCRKLISYGRLTEPKYRQCIQNLSEQQINWELIAKSSPYDLPWTVLRLTLVFILLHCEYDILILDEPTFGLGQQQKLTLYHVLEDYLSQKHLVLISHDLEFVYGLSDTVLSFDTMRLETNYQKEQKHEQR